ncbi:hypothetical protein AV530_001615 [Patagioenas fasciata monilis]|uniref:Uncharacterized protein n=1 Tax=Patagioenas fasciata monilis TaxID=372326 RepID=A0A1V4K543_PATFA|nr:hypothetical protein AV530_001615 [Patagioenas fasciata monilis]
MWRKALQGLDLTKCHWEIKGTPSKHTVQQSETIKHSENWKTRALQSPRVWIPLETGLHLLSRKFVAV